jgi:hypothetical protein
MADATTQVTSEALTKVNRLAVVSIVCAAIALAGTLRVGVVVIAVFAVGGYPRPRTAGPRRRPHWRSMAFTWHTTRTITVGGSAAGGPRTARPRLV